MNAAYLNDATRRPDPGPSPRTTRAERIVKATIDHMIESGELCKGSEPALLARVLAVGNDRGGGPARCVAALFEHLETADGAVFLNPEFKRARGVSPLRKVIERLPVRESVAGRFVEDWMLSANQFTAARFTAAGMDPETAAAHAMEALTRHVMTRLDGDDASWAWSEELAPERDYREVAVLEALREWRGVLAVGTDVDRLAREPDWRALGTRAAHEIHATILARLQGPYADLARSAAAVARVDPMADLFLPANSPLRSDRRPPEPVRFGDPAAPLNKVGPDPDSHGRYAPA